MVASAPLVVSAFLRLRREDVKHPYQVHRTVLVPADYFVFCTNTSLSPRQPSPCRSIEDARASPRGKWKAGVATETHAWSVDQMVEELASKLDLAPTAVRAAAQRSVVPIHCPSAELVMIWLIKPFLVAKAMAAHPERAGLFAWVDAGFNVYQMRPFGPPPPPWLTFQPREGRLAVAREAGGCHNELHRANRSRCVVGTFLYGSRSAWDAFVPLYAQRVRQLIQGHAGASMVAPLCADQDIIEDVASHAPHLFDEFDVSDAWGWSHAQPHVAERRRKG
jgi:hypothetical protein